MWKKVAFVSVLMAIAVSSFAPAFQGNPTLKSTTIPMQRFSGDYEILRSGNKLFRVEKSMGTASHMIATSALGSSDLKWVPVMGEAGTKKSRYQFIAVPGDQIMCMDTATGDSWYTNSVNQEKWNWNAVK